MPGDPGDYRSKVRSLIAAHAPSLRQEGVRAPRTAEEEAAIRRWLRILYEEGLVGGGWPVEWGGRADHRPSHDLIVMEELIRAHAYRPLDQVMLASHALLQFGTDMQKADLLPKIRAGAHIWCQLFSEPDAGSDLSALRTRAVRDGGAFVVSGHKTWTTDAQWADIGLLLARTDPSAERHGGLTAFVVPMDRAGVEVRPIREMTGHAEFCDVFLDGVRLGPEHVLGQVDGGWEVVTSGLASERAFVGANAVLLEMLVADLVLLARTARLPDGTRALEHEDVQAQLAEALARVEQVKLIVRDTVEPRGRAEQSPADGAIAKLSYSELNVRLCELAMDIWASSTSIDEPGATVAQRWRENFLWSRALTISGGASEILRGLIARQLLGLPRS